MGGSSSAQKSAVSKASETILEEVRSHPVVMYTKHHCPYCVRAKNELKEDGIQFSEKNLNELAKEKPDIQAYVTGLIELTKQKTVPQIFVCGRFIGGYTEMHAKRDEWAKMVRECSTDGVLTEKKAIRPKL